MKTARFSFSLIKLNDFIYVAGGRTYGNDELSILRKCEKYSLKEDRWIDIADLNYRRCSCGISVLKEQIIVYGGLHHGSQRLNNFEIYDESNDTW